MPQPIRLKIKPGAGLSSKLQEISLKKNMGFVEIHTNVLELIDFAPTFLTNQNPEVVQKIICSRDKTILFNNFDKALPLVKLKLQHLFDEIDPSCKVYIAG